MMQSRRLKTNLVLLQLHLHQLPHQKIQNRSHQLRKFLTYQMKIKGERITIVIIMTHPPNEIFG
jgi:hypothetical protein